jgi:hypothetical protein
MQVQTESFPRIRAMREGRDSSEKATDGARRAMQPCSRLQLQRQGKCKSSRQPNAALSKRQTSAVLWSRTVEPGSRAGARALSLPCQGGCSAASDWSGLELRQPCPARQPWTLQGDAGPMRAQRPHFAVPLGSRPSMPSGDSCCIWESSGCWGHSTFSLISGRLRCPVDLNI